MYVWLGLVIIEGRFVESLRVLIEQAHTRLVSSYLNECVILDMYGRMTR